MNYGLHRKPAVAGTFYPESPDALRLMLEEFLEQSGVDPAKEAVAAIIVPHAGYVYSGSTAACAFRRIAGSDIRRAILLGCSHRYSFEGASIVTSGSAFVSVRPLSSVGADADAESESSLCAGWSTVSGDNSLIEVSTQRDRRL